MWLYSGELLAYHWYWLWMDWKGCVNDFPLPRGLPTITPQHITVPELKYPEILLNILNQLCTYIGHFNQEIVDLVRTILREFCVMKEDIISPTMAITICCEIQSLLSSTSNCLCTKSYIFVGHVLSGAWIELAGLQGGQVDIYTAKNLIWFLNVNHSNHWKLYPIIIWIGPGKQHYTK